MNWRGGLRPGLLNHVLLPAWFAAMTAVHLATTSTTRQAIGLDARIYYRGAEAWVHGGDPWSAFAQMANGHFHFAGLPPTVQILAPFTFLPEDAFVVVAMVATLVAGTYILWKLKLPGSWLVFPPVAQALISANPQLVVLALLLASWPLLKAVSVMLKVYAIVPLVLEMRWRAVAVAIGLLAVSLALGFALWGNYISRFTAISQRLDAEAAGGFSAWSLPISSLLVVLMALAVLAVLDRRAAAWLTVPALWPATQLHYSAFALPVINPVMAFALAIPQHGIPVAVVLGLALWRSVQYLYFYRKALLRRQPQRAPQRQ